MSSIFKATLSGGMPKIIERFSERTVRKAGNTTSRSVDLLIKIVRSEFGLDYLE